MQARAVTDEAFGKATCTTYEALPKKREMASESNSEAETGKSRRQQSKRKKATVRVAGVEGFGDQISECMKASYCMLILILQELMTQSLDPLQDSRH